MCDAISDAGRLAVGDQRRAAHHGHAAPLDPGRALDVSRPTTSKGNGGRGRIGHGGWRGYRPFAGAYLPMLIACLQDLPHFKSIMSFFGLFVGSIGGAFGGGLPQTRPGLLASLPLSLVAPSLIIAWYGLATGFLMRAEDCVCMTAVFVILASSAVFASVAAWRIRKIAGEIAEETANVNRSADAHDRD